MPLFLLRGGAGRGRPVAGPFEPNSDYSQYALLDGYDVKITVNEDNTFDITETIDAFLMCRNTHYPQVADRNEVERLTEPFRATGENHRPRRKRAVRFVRFGRLPEIKIGEEETTLTGAKQYRIRYNYNIGKDTGKDYDEFYFDIIGGEWIRPSAASPYHRHAEGIRPKQARFLKRQNRLHR